MMPAAPTHGRKFARVVVAAAGPSGERGTLGTRSRLEARQDITYSTETDLLTLARLLIAQGKLAEASALLQRLIDCDGKLRALDVVSHRAAAMRRRA